MESGAGGERIWRDLAFRKSSGGTTDAVRTAILSNAGGGRPIPDVMNGHGDRPHIAIASLPFSGADGHLVGFAVILPRSAGSEERRAVHGACARLQDRGVHLSKVPGD